jgi:ABC-2 type transport system ATP-binding protein
MIIPDKIIDVAGLVKKYADLTAVNDISFSVHKGEIFGMVGPNGAGKTTTIECIEGLRRPDGGRIRLLDCDPSRGRTTINQQVGIQLQESALPPRMRVKEALDLFGSFYREQESSATLLERLGLAEKSSSFFGKLSGGQKQRLFIALALVNKPKVVFFDELTTGLDPQARHSMWNLVRQVRERGCTVFLTTHFMEEAERLCDRVLIMDHGRIVALDTPEALISQLKGEKRVVFNLAEDIPTPSFQGLGQVTKVERIGERLVVYGQGERFTSRVVACLEDLGLPLRDMRTEQPNLEDVFLALTGREMKD